MSQTHLGGHNAVVGVTLGDVSLCSGRGLLVRDVHRPVVHPVVLPGTLHTRAEVQRSNCWLTLANE